MNDRSDKLVLLSPAVGGGNLGDEGILAAAIKGIRAQRPNARIQIVSPNPEDTTRRYAIQAYGMAWARRGISPPGATIPNTPDPDCNSQPTEANGWTILKSRLKRAPRVHSLLKSVQAALQTLVAVVREMRFLVGAWNQLGGSSLFLMVGSGALCDHFGGPATFAYPIFKWFLLARVRGIPSGFLSVGAGPLYSRLSRLLIRFSLKTAEYRSVRDVTSQRILDDLGVPGTTPILPDLAFGLEPPAIRYAPGPGGLTVGINLFPHYDPRFWPEPDPVRYQRYLTCMTSFADWLRENGYRVLLFPTHVRADVRVIHDLKTASSLGGNSDLLEPQIADVQSLLMALAQTDIVIASRFHGILFSFLCGRPVIAITNHHKMSDLMESMGQAKYSVDVDSLTLESLTSMFKTLEAQRAIVVNEVHCRRSEFQLALDRQYASILNEYVPS